MLVFVCKQVCNCVSVSSWSEMYKNNVDVPSGVDDAIVHNYLTSFVWNCARRGVMRNAFEVSYKCARCPPHVSQGKGT